MHRKQYYRRPSQLDGIYQKILGYMVEKLCQRQGVVADAGHQVPHYMAVVIGKRQPLAVTEHLGAHVALYLRAQIMSLIVIEVCTQRLDRHQRRQPGPEHTGIVPRVQQRAGYEANPQRHSQRYAGRRQGADEVRGL